MSHHFEGCLKSRGLRRCAVDPAKIEREITEARKDLASAQNSLLQSDYKWSIIKAYYSMFHACKSLLFSAGYVEKSHDCLIFAMQELFVDPGLLPSTLARTVRDAKSAREAADYGLTYSDDAARMIVQDAEEVYRIVAAYHSKGPSLGSR